MNDIIMNTYFKKIFIYKCMYIFRNILTIEIKCNMVFTLNYCIFIIEQFTVVKKNVHNLQKAQ